MIDDQKKTVELIRKMKSQLPIPAKASKPFVQSLRERGVKIKPKQVVQIKDVLYLGDDGGIACAVDTGQDKSAVISSLTHLRVDVKHPLAEEIRSYQTERTQKLAQMEVHQRVRKMFGK
jgi:hypothetical protein